MEETPQKPLEDLRYAQLQRLAKAAGLRANLKADKLLNALKKHFAEVQEKRSAISRQRAPSNVGTEELNSSQPSPVNRSLVTQRRRKQKGREAQQSLKDESANDEITELSPEEKILTVLVVNQRSEDAEEILNQNIFLADSGTAKKSTTPSQLRERSSTKRKRNENFTPVNLPSEKKCRSAGKIRTTTPTPNFKKLHEAQFKKMQSIDEYIEKKKKMIKNFNSSVNEVKVLARKGNCLKMPQQATQNSNSKAKSSFRGFIFSPYSQRKNRSAPHTPVNLQSSPKNYRSVNKNVLSQKSAFNSINVSTRKMNVRFSESTRDNEHKRSLTKTPSRKIPFLKSFTPESQKSSTSVTNNLKGSATKCQLKENAHNVAFTPFKFSGQTAEPTSSKKTAFDLQASLSRPLNYRPHRGKLKPWDQSTENISNFRSLKRNYKQPLVLTREERREKHEKGRKQRKDLVLGSRRGVTVA